MIRFDGSEAHRRLETFPGKLCISFFLLFLPFRFIFYLRSNNSFFLPSIFLSTFLFLSSLLSLHFHSNLSLLLILPKKNFLPSPSFSSSSSFSPFFPSSTNIQLFISSEYKFIQARSIHFPSSFFRPPLSPLIFAQHTVHLVPFILPPPLHTSPNTPVPFSLGSAISQRPSLSPPLPASPDSSNAISSNVLVSTDR